MGTPVPPQEPFGEDAMRDAEKRAEEQAEEVRRERVAESGEITPEGSDPPSARAPWWRRLFPR